LNKFKQETNAQETDESENRKRQVFEKLKIGKAKKVYFIPSGMSI